MLDRKSAPPFVRKTDFKLIQPDRRALNNGSTLFFVLGGAQDVVRIDLIFKAGRWFETTTGASHLTSNLLTKGTRTKSSFEIAQIFDLYGSHVEVSAGLDFVSISLYTLQKNLKPSLDLLIEVLCEPSFPDKEIEQFKTIYSQTFKVNLEKTSFLATKYFREHLFGNDHPYGRELDDVKVDKLDQAHLIVHHRRFFASPDVFVSGKLTDADKTFILTALSNLPNQPVTSGQPENYNAVMSKVRLEKEGAVQSTIRMGRKSLQRTHPDYAGATFVCHLLGGYFGSRLMKNIREEKGLTYGIYCSIHPLKHDSYFVIGADVDRDNVELTKDEIRKELSRLSSEPVGLEELTVAKNHFIGSVQSEITTAFAHADKWKTIYLFDLSPNFYQEMILSIESMTPSKISEIAEKYFNADNLLEVAAG